MLGGTTKAGQVLRMGKNADSDLAEVTFAQDQGRNVADAFFSSAPDSYHGRMSKVL